MPERTRRAFPPGVADRLSCYVYRLLDPRTGQTFYVGKGRRNRVFAHIRGELEADGESEKLQRVREINLAGFEVVHVIHRHGLSEQTALEVEAALMDAYPGLTNVSGGVGSSARGAMHADEIIRQYSAAEAIFTDDEKCLLINVNREASERDLYEAVRYAWRVSARKAQQADVVLATLQGMIVGAFIAEEWLPATVENFPGRAEGNGADGRHGFVGKEASREVQRRYVGKRVPDRFRKRGAANPIRYSY